MSISLLCQTKRCFSNNDAQYRSDDEKRNKDADQFHDKLNLLRLNSVQIFLKKFVW